jgi:hypothetical protein
MASLENSVKCLKKININSTHYFPKKLEEEGTVLVHLKGLILSQNQKQTKIEQKSLKIIFYEYKHKNIWQNISK